MPRKKVTEIDETNETFETNINESEGAYEETEKSTEENGTDGENGDGAIGETEEKTKAKVQKPQTRQQINLTGIGKNSELDQRERLFPKEKVLTVDSDDEIATQEDIENTNWHEIRNAHATRKILTGSLDGIENTESGIPLAIITYKTYRIIIPVKEMNINLTNNKARGTMLERQSRILGNMIGCEIDFVIKGIDNKARSVVASRKDAMLRKQKRFFEDIDAEGLPRVNDNQVVQARITAVSEKAIRVDVFGVETSIWANELSHDFISDARDKFNIGDKVLVRVLKITNEDDEIKLTASIKAVQENYQDENLKKCSIQGKYAGTITEIKNGIVFIRLNMGVNAIAHSCMDKRTPGKNDSISFVVTKIDAEKNVAVGLINRIIKQNI